MVKKAPRRTAERILEVTLDLFNRFGEPNVSTTLISAELSISPGNLYYHYPAKDELINSLFDRYERALSELLNASDGVRDVEDAWFFMSVKGLIKVSAIQSSAPEEDFLRARSGGGSPPSTSDIVTEMSAMPSAMQWWMRTSIALPPS